MGVAVIVFLMVNAIAFDYTECVNPELAGGDVPGYCVND